MYDTVIIKNFIEFAKFINEHKGENPNIGYDVETNAKLLQSQDHKVIGFSLAFSKDIGIYVPIKALDFTLAPNDKRLIEKLMTQLLTKNKVTVYNCLHEYPATRNWLNIDIPNLTDVFVMVKLMMGNADQYEGNGGLKIQSAIHLGFDNWSEDVKEYFKYIRNPASYQTDLKTFLLKYYDESEIPHLMDLIYAIPKEELKPKTISYEYIPYKVIGKYGSLDSTVLLALHDYYVDWMKKESETLGVDLFTGYNVWMNHHYAGYVLESNGAHWNDEKAEEVAKWCDEGTRSANLALIRSPLSQAYIQQNLNDLIEKEIMLKYTHLIAPDYVPVSITKHNITVTCTNKTASAFLRAMSLVSKTTKKDPNIEKWTLKPGNFMSILKHKVSNGILDQTYIDQLRLETFTNIREAYINAEKYSSLFNPNGNTDTFKNYVNQILITDDIRFSKLYFDFLAFMDKPAFDMDYFKDFYDPSSHCINNSPKFVKHFDMATFKTEHPEFEYKASADSKLLEFVLKLSKSQCSGKYRLFKKFLSESPKFRTYQIKNLITHAGKYKLPKLDDNNIIELYTYFEFAGIDIDDRNTWTPQFEWLFNFRWFKKYLKLKSTYITGKVGRGSVWLVPKKRFESGEAFTPRICPYFSETADKIRSNPEEYKKYDLVLQTEFKPNQAETGRWTATLHTIPSGNTIKGIIQSRYKGGVIAMPDCSQAEVRVLARVANDDNLLNAFRKGLDIHRYVASLVNSIPIEEVTPIQRKVAKSAVFGILYGESEQAFADEHFGGDVAKAHEIYLYFYNAFPGIKEYVDKCHEYCKKYGKVVLELTGRYIDMTKFATNSNGDSDKILRQSQNFPIQGQASDLAGLILYRICEFLAQKGLKTKPFCIIHDSIEIDMHPDETFWMLDQVKPLFNKFPDDEYGIPMASDMVFSCNMGSEIELVDMIHDEDYNDVTITLSGFKSDIDEVIETWESVYDLVERDTTFEETSKDVYVPLRGLFMKKVVISKEMGTTKQKITCRYHVIRKAVKSTVALR